MAEFNIIKERANPPQALGYSRGGQDTNAFGKLFSGIGDAIGMAAETIDTDIQENIKSDVYEAYDRTNTEFGVTDRQLFEQDPGKGLPNDIQQAGENLKRMNAAVAQGNLSDTHYWARMEAQVRQLRAKYPGYREQIDSMVSGVTGQTPANALRRQIMAENEASATKASSEEAKFQTWLQQNYKYLPPDVAEGYASGKYDKLELQTQAAKGQQHEHGIDLKKKEAELLSKEGQMNQENAFTMGKEEVNTLSNDIFSNVTMTLGANRQSFYQMVAGAQDPSGDGGKGVTPDEQMMITQTFGTLKEKFQMELQNRIQNPWVEGGKNSYATILSAEQQKEMVDLGMARLSIIEDALKNENWGLLAAKQQEITARKAQATLNAITGPGGDILLNVQAVVGITGEEFFNKLYFDSGMINSEYTAAVNAAIVSSLKDNKTLTDQLKVFRDTGVTDATAYNELITKFANSVITDGITEQGATAMAMQIFGSGNEGMMNMLKSPADREKVFNTLTSRAMTQKIQKLAANNPEVWEAYEGWSLRSFTTLFKTTADTVQDSVVSNPNVEITFDPKTKQFKMENMASLATAGKALLMPGGMLDAAMNLEQTNAAQTAIGRINQAMRQIDPIISATGGDTAEELSKAFESMGIQLSAGKQPDFWQGLGKAVIDATTKARGDETGLQDAYGRTQGGSQKSGASPLAPSIFDFRDGMSDRLTNEVSDDELRGYAGRDYLAEQKAGLDARITALQKAQGGSLVSKQVGAGTRVAEGEDATVRASEEAGRASQLLDFIGGLEAPLGYNQVYGHNRMAPLDEMTVSQVLSYQRDRVRKGSPSSAVGRYQFIRGTLKGLVQELGLTGEEKFTPELQDRLAIHLLKRRGLNRYLEGRTTLEQFGNSLAKEWASLPVVAGKKKGRSFYAGDGLNKSLTGVDDALEAIASLAD